MDNQNEMILTHLNVYSTDNPVDYIISLHNFLFLIPLNPNIGIDSFPTLNSNCTLLSCDEWPSFIGVQILELNDIHIVKSFSDILFINAQLSEFKDKSYIWKLSNKAIDSNLRVFYEISTKHPYVPDTEPIDFMEFVLSDYNRIRSFPRHSVFSKNSSIISNQNFVFVFDLLQDQEILKPIIQAIYPLINDTDFLIAIVSDRVRNSQTWSRLESFLTNLNIKISNFSNALTAAAQLPYDGVLFTCSESSALGHKFSYELCQLAPSKMLKCTFQHGYENVGLRHHIAHNMASPEGIRFKSDIIFTWAHEDQLEDAHPFDLLRCIPIGVVKSIATDSVLARKRLLKKILTIGETEDNKVDYEIHVSEILLCENLHSVRFKDNALAEAFKRVMFDLQDSPYANLFIRSHPGKRLLELDPAYESFKFVSGELNCKHIQSYDYLLSPPSTIILDGALCCVPTAIWSSTADSGDLYHYRGIPFFKNADDLIDMIVSDDINQLKIILSNLRWAAKNTASFDGSKFILSRLSEILS